MKKKIVYINGYKGENSSKAGLLKDKFDAIHIVLKDDFNPKEVCKLLERIQPDITIASSTGCYVADACSYDKGIFIYLNPLVELNDLAKLTDTTKLKDLKPISKNTLVLINIDDEILDHRKIVLKYSNYKVFKKGGHRFKNFDDLVDVINNLE
jgi:hypothetical protein